MSNQPFDRVIYNLREKPLSPDLNQLQSQLDRSLREVSRLLMGERVAATDPASAPVSGFIGTSFVVTPTAGMVVSVEAGIGFYYDVTGAAGSIDGIVGLDDLSTYKPIVLAANTTFAVPAAPGVNTRIDIIEVRVDRETTDLQSRLVLDVATGAFAPSNVDKILAFSVDGDTGFVTDPAPSTAALSYKTGIVAGAPVEPAVTSGYVKVARINVGTSVVSITAADIASRRPILGAGGILQASVRYRLQWNAGAPIITFDSVVAPPGCSFGIVADTVLRGQALVSFIGGEIASSTVDVAVINPAAQAEGIDYVTPRVSASPSFGGYFAELAATEAALLGLTAGVGQKRVSVKVNSLFVAGATGVASVTNAALEDLRYTVSFSVGY